MLETVLQDCRYGWRTLAKAPRFTFTAIVTLAVGIAANVAIFTCVNAVLIRPLPYADAGQLVAIYETPDQAVESKFEASYPDYLDWQKQQQTFTSIAGFNQDGAILHEGTAEALPAALVSDTFFATLGVKPVAGRDFRPGEDLPSAPPLVMLSYGWWQKHFGGKDVVGQTLALDDKSYTVIGVLPADFHFAPVGDPLIWRTLRPEGPMLERRNLHWVNVVARLKPGVSHESAAASMNVIADGLEKLYPQSHTNLRTAIMPLNEVIVGQIRPILLVLLSAVGLLLLIACANVANLLLARSVSRSKEMAVRAALGASHWRLIRQMLTEGVILSLAGGVLGMAGAAWVVKAFLAVIPEPMLDSMPYLKTLAPDARVLLFALALALMTGALFGLAPAARLSQRQVQDGIKDGARSSHSGSWRRFASILVISEIAISLVLLFGAGLLGKSLYCLLRVDPGFNHRNLLMLGVAMPQTASYSRAEQQVIFYRSLMQTLQVMPGIKSAGITSILPVGGGTTANIRVVGQPYSGQGFEANIRNVDAGYFPTLQAQLLQGRWFYENDNTSAPRRVIVNKTFVDMYMHGLDPLAQQVVFTSSPTNKPQEVVGVVRDVKEGSLDSPAYPAIYVPYLQSPGPFFNVVVRTGQNPASMLSAVEGVVHQVNPDLVSMQAQTMENRIQRSPAAFLHSFPAWLSGAFAAMALLLGSIGLYGLVAYSVSERTQEIGIRMALGAQRSNVLGMILMQGVRLITPGIAIGVAASFLASSLLRGLLFGVTGSDPAIFIAVSLLLAAVTLAASVIPARQATRVDPMVALRHE